MKTNNEKNLRANKFEKVSENIKVNMSNLKNLSNKNYEKSTHAYPVNFMGTGRMVED